MLIYFPYAQIYYFNYHVENKMVCSDWSFQPFGEVDERGLQVRNAGNFACSIEHTQQPAL